MPEFNYAAAKQAGWSDDEINDFLEKKNAQGADLYISKAAIQQASQPQQEVQSEPGFIQSAVQGITNLPLRLGTGAVKAATSLAGLVGGGAQYLAGDKEGAKKTVSRAADIVDKMNTEGVDLGYFGNVKPFMAEADTAETFGGQAKGFLKDTIGGGLEASSYVIGGPALKTGLGVAKGAIPLIKGIGSSAVRAVPSGAAGLAGMEMQKEDATIGSVTGAGLIGAVSGLLLGGASPIAGKAAGKTIQTILNPVKTVGGALESAGNKILTTVIKPAQKDVKDGFLIENVTKYGVGGNLQDSFDATAREISARVKLQRQMIQNNPADIDIGNVFQLTEQALSKGKLENVGELGAIRRVLNQLKENLEEATGKKIEPGATVSVPDAQLLKQGFGKKGAWEFGKASPDAKAEEAVYNQAYTVLKEAIEIESPLALKEVNKQLSELIPIQNAIIRRMPVDARNNALSLTDSIALAAAMANPKALSLIGLQRLLKSGEFGKVLAEKGASMLKKEKSLIPKIKIPESLKKPKVPPQSAAGVSAGIEAEKDEKGNITGYKIDPAKAALGVLAAGTLGKNSKTFKELFGDLAEKFKTADSFYRNARLRAMSNISEYGSPNEKMLKEFFTEYKGGRSTGAKNSDKPSVKPDNILVKQSQLAIPDSARKNPKGFFKMALETNAPEEIKPVILKALGSDFDTFSKSVVKSKMVDIANGLEYMKKNNITLSDSYNLAKKERSKPAVVESEIPRVREPKYLVDIKKTISKLHFDSDTTNYENAVLNDLSSVLKDLTFGQFKEAVKLINESEVNNYIKNELIDIVRRYAKKNKLLGDTFNKKEISSPEIKVKKPR